METYSPLKKSYGGAINLTAGNPTTTIVVTSYEGSPGYGLKLINWASLGAQDCNLSINGSDNIGFKGSAAGYDERGMLLLENVKINTFTVTRISADTTIYWYVW